MSSRNRCNAAFLISRCDEFMPAFLRQHGSHEVLLCLLAVSVCGLTTMAMAASPGALPAGARIASGQASINQSGTAMSVMQQSDRAVIEWNTFNIGHDASVTFRQPSSNAVALNRVTTSDPSRIFGRLTANGQVFLINPSGILFGPGARVNVGGLVASSMSIRNTDFMEGKYRFSRDSANGQIANEGIMAAADGGYLALLSSTVRNAGSMTVNAGSVVLAAGDKVALDISGNGMLDVKVDPATIKALVENHGLIKVEGGSVLLTAEAVNGLIGATVSNAGAIVASSMVNDGGTIRLVGNDVQLGGHSRTSAGGRNGGVILITAKGATGTAEVRTGARIDANADEEGNGGHIVLRSEGLARIGGTIEARGGDRGGNGGFVETSGEILHLGPGAAISAAAPRGESGQWLLDPLDITVDAMLAASLAGALNGGTNATVATTLNDPALSGTGSGDITVSSPVSWNTANTLTLSAYRNVVIEQPLAASSAGSVVLRADSQGTGTGTVSFTGSGVVTTAGAGSVKIYYNPVAGNYTAPTDYTSHVSGGTLTAWMLVNNATQLQAMKDALGGNYALGRDIDAGATSSWNSGEGFAPVGNNGTPFSGQFDGLGKTISNLTINRPSASYVGVFGYNSGSVRNVILTNGAITGNNFTGALAGSNTGTVSGTSSTVSVAGNDNVGGLVGESSGGINNSSSSGNVSGGNQVGGLAGNVTGSIGGSHATGAVSGNDNIGGLLGSGNGATFSNVYATGAVSGNDNVGGLIGYSNGVVSDVHATGSVTGTGWRVGGLIGEAGGGSINNAYATGAVSVSGNYVGGLVGQSNAAITSSSASNTVQGNDNVGGLAGSNAGSVATSRSSGTISGINSVGGLAGSNTGSVATSHSSGMVSGNDNVGGLIGYNTGSASNVYATGAVTGAGWNVGGLVGNLQGGGLTMAYAKGAVSGNGNYYGGLVGFNNASVSAAFASGAVSAQNNVGGLVGENGGTVTNAFASGTVNGNDRIGGLIGTNTGTLTKAYASGAVTGSQLVGGLAAFNSGTVTGSFWDTDATGQASSAGGTGMTTAQMMTGANFTSATAANGNINPNWNFGTDWLISEGAGRPRLIGLLTPLSVILNAATKTYDGLAYMGGNGVTYSGFVDGDTATSLTGILAYSGSSQGALNAGTYVLSGSGLSSGKYEITYVDSTLTIWKKALTAVAGSKVYDGMASASLSLSGLVGSQTLTLAVTSSVFDNKNAGAGKTVTASGISIADGGNGGLASNYSIGASLTTTATIAPRPLAVTASGSSKVYDGTASADVTLTDDHLGGDGVSVGYGGAAFADKNAGAGKAVHITGLTLTGADAGNYIPPSGATATASITPRTLTVTATGHDKVYDATTNATVALADNRIAGDAVSIVYGGAVFADKSVGTGKTISVSGLALAAADSGNYTLLSPTATTRASITPVELRITGLAAADKVYDGTHGASLSGARISPIGLDRVSLTSEGAVGSFDDKNVGTNKRVTFAGYALTGEDAANYVLVSPLSLSASITPKPLTFSQVNADSKFFDGSTMTQGSVSLSGFVGNETVTAIVSRAEFNSSVPGNGKKVVLSDMRLVDGLNGGLATNYLLPAESAFTLANIRQLPVSLVSPIAVAPWLFSLKPVPPHLSGSSVQARPIMESVQTKLPTDADENEN